FSFNNIMLPDSFVNEPGSNGFVQFLVKRKTDIPFGTEISNTAAIYFDYNEPIITNTVVNIFSEPSSISELQKTKFGFIAYPNPTNNTLNITTTLQGFNNIQYQIINTLGAIVNTNIVNTNDFSIDVKSMSSGIYFIHLQSGNAITVKKFVKE